MSIARSLGVALLMLSATASAQDDRVKKAAPARHANPRLKASYRIFSIAALEGSNVWLNGAQLDAYALSRRWVRVGVELEGGAGKTSLRGGPVDLAYGLLGLTAGVQYPARVTPFVEGRAIGGVLHAALDGRYTIGKVVVDGVAATTYVYGGGIETGAEVYAVHRMYVSVALGWVRTRWRGPDTAAMIANPEGGVQTKELSADSFTLKAGLGI